MTFQSVITEFWNLLGLTYPETAIELVYDVFIMFIGLYIIKYAMLFIISLFRDMLKIH